MSKYRVVTDNGAYEVETQDPQTFSQQVKDAAQDAFKIPAEDAMDLATNPVTQAKALPPLAGIAGAISPIPGGATLGTVGGRQISNEALRLLGHPEAIPSAGSQVIEGALAGAGDIAAIPAIKKSVFGNQIAAAEEASGVPQPQDIPSLPKPKAGEAVSGGIDSAIDSVRSANGQGTPTYWKQIKDQVDAFYNSGKDMKLSNLDRAKLAWLNGQVQSGLNASVPGRAAPAAALASSQTIPNAISNTVSSIPWWGKAAITGVGGDALLRALSKVGQK